MATATKPVESGDVAQTDPELADARAEIEALKAELAKSAPAPEPESDDEPATPTHVLNLACGHAVVTAVPVASHHFCDDDERTVPVVAAYELREED